MGEDAVKGERPVRRSGSHWCHLMLNVLKGDPRRIAGVGLDVVLAEDSYLMREGLVSLLDAADDVTLVATAEDYDGLMAAVAEHSPAVVITDIRMPPSQTDEGIRAAAEIRRDHPDTGVVVLSQYAEPEYAVKLFADGRLTMRQETAWLDDNTLPTTGVKL